MAHTISLDARYDGPVPFWERPECQGDGMRKLRRMMNFDRQMARRYIAAIRGADAADLDRLRVNLAYHVECHHSHARALGAMTAGRFNLQAAE